jgi:RND family efflux transporter MFP subunit
LPVVEITVAESKAMTRNIELTGTIEAARVARIASPAEGPVLNCSIREGDTVKKEQVFLTIGRKRAAEEQVEAARKELTREEEDLQRIEQLVRSGALPAEQIEESQLRVSRAKAQLTKALESIEDYQIRAPWPGIVSKVFVTDGYFVSPRETLLEIFDPKTLIIRFAVPEKESNNVHNGMTLFATLDTYNDRVFKAKITRLFPELDRKMHTRIVEASLIEDVDVVPGMFTRISIPVQTVNNAIMIPDKAIIITPQGEKVVFVVKKGKAFRQEVSIGIEQNHMVQITEGIQVGDSVVVSGNQKLQDGMGISILNHEQSSNTEKSNELIK